MTQNRATDDIFNDFLLEFETSGDEALERYAREYPELTEILYRRAGSARMFKKLPETEMTAEEEQSLNLRASSVVQNILFELRGQSKPEAPASVPETAPLVSLGDDLQRVGETFESAATTLRLSPLIVKLLGKRRVRVESIPALLIAQLAELLRRSVEQVRLFLEQRPAPQGGYFKATAAPKISAQSEFSELVESDPYLSTEDKEHWRSSAAV
ncbi:MAG: hypothetical protein AB7J13_06450 [Pyrinomonadaceae bacterium]